MILICCSKRSCQYNAPLTIVILLYVQWSMQSFPDVMWCHEIVGSNLVAGKLAFLFIVMQCCCSFSSHIFLLLLSLCLNFYQVNPKLNFMSAGCEQLNWSPKSSPRSCPVFITWRGNTLRVSYNKELNFSTIIFSCKFFFRVYLVANLYIVLIWLL